MVRRSRQSAISVIGSIVIIGALSISTAIAETTESVFENIDLTSTSTVSPSTIDNNGSETTTIVNIGRQSDKPTVCAPPLLIHGSVDPVKNEYKTKDVIQILCNNGFELANPQSSLLYCSQDGLWKVFTLGDNIILPLPRCIVKRPCPQLPPLIQGSIHVQGSEGSGLGLEPPRAVYQCWFGLVLEPAESEVRYCIQGKWTGENPQCVRAGCGRPATIAHGYYTMRGMVNHVYQTGSSLKYHCDSGYQLNGPAVFTCSWDKEWTPKVSPSCTPIKQTDNEVVRGCPLPPTLATGEYKILLWRNGNGEPAVGAANSSLVPVYSSAMLFCHDGYILHGSPLISCSSHGWWQPFTLPRCVPANPYGNGMSDDVHGSMPWMVSLTSAFTVIFLLSFVWIVTRLRINCRKNRTPASPSSTAGSASGVGQSGGSLVCRAPGPASSSGPVLVVPRRRRPFWDWMLTNPALMGGPVHSGQGRAGSAQVGGDSGMATPTDQDRVALIAYIGDTQAALPTYEEAVRSSMTTTTTTTSWPVAPPPYESILIDAAPDSSAADASDTRNLLQSSDVAIVSVASPDECSPVDAADRTGFGQVPVPSSAV